MVCPLGIVYLLDNGSLSRVVLGTDVVNTTNHSTAYKINV